MRTAAPLAFGVALWMGCAEPGPCPDDGTDCGDPGQSDTTSPDVVGSWSKVQATPLFFAHGALLHTGKVVMFSGHADDDDQFPLASAVWDPASGELAMQDFPGAGDRDIYCGGQSHLADGRLIVIGGGGRTILDAVPVTNAFDPARQEWTTAAEMSVPRWYGAVLPLADGRLLAASGADGVQPIEIYDPGDDRWSVLAGAERDFGLRYPSLHLLPTGEVFFSHVGWADGLFDTTRPATSLLVGLDSDAPRWIDAPAPEFSDRREGTSAFLVDQTRDPIGSTVIIFGGGSLFGNNNPKSAEKIDLSEPEGASWTRAADMAFARTNANAVVLPDGKVLVIGGQQNGKFDPDPEPVRVPELYDPVTDAWTALASHDQPRQYHSIAILLPDGRVLVAGGIDPTKAADPMRANQHSLEVFSPPYLFGEPRPEITSAPDRIAHGSQFVVATPDPEQIAIVSLLHPASTTHHTDGGQRWIRLPFSTDEDRLRVSAPADGNVAPAGHYMLFVVSKDGIPSEARFVSVSSSD